MQNAGAKNASTGLGKSAIIQKISLAQAASVSDRTDAVGLVNITAVPSSPMVLNPNGKAKVLKTSLIIQGDRGSPVDY